MKRSGDIPYFVFFWALFSEQIRQNFHAHFEGEGLPKSQKVYKPLYPKKLHF